MKIGILLTSHECQIAQLILFGYSVKGAGAKLGISPATVKLHRSNLYSKLDISSQSELFSLSSMRSPRQKTCSRIP